MKLAYKQFLELCKPRVFNFGELSDGMIIWWEYTNYGYTRIITDTNWSHDGNRCLYEELLPHIMAIYVEREFRGEVWNVELPTKEESL